MSRPSVRRFPLWLQAAGVALAAGLAVSLIFGRAGWKDWQQPHWLEGDPLEVYARVQIAAEQPVHALTSFTQPARLGAPFGADWSTYPVPDRIIFVATGALSRQVGLIAAVQLVSAGFFLLNAVSFFLCARWLRWRWEWAAALALSFAFCNYNLRWGITLSLGQSFTLPPLVLLCAHAARRRGSRLSLNWLALAAVLGVWLGLGNPYLAFFAGLVGGGALLLGLLRRAPAARLAPLLVFLGLLTLVFVAGNATYAWQHWQEGASGALARDLSDFSRYALRPSDWFVPPADHRIEAFSRLGRAYVAARHGNGEFFYDYLGLIGLGGLFWLTLAALRRVRHANGVGFEAALGLLWILALGIDGGINTWLGAAGIDMFRASTRLGIFAFVWISFFLCSRLSAVTRAWPRVLSLLLAALCAVFACWEQTPALHRGDGVARNARLWRTMRETGARLEQALPAGAAIFQLPAVPFPEAGRTGTMGDYEHFLPFLASRRLHFSYGQIRTTQAYRWARQTASLAPSNMIPTLAQAGYAALWIDRRGIANEAADLIAQLRQMRLQELPVPGGLPVTVFRLPPAGTPALPTLDDVRLDEAWDDRPARAGSPRLYAVRGWFGLERDGERRWRWAGRRAELGLWWDGAPGTTRLTFTVGGAGGRLLRLRVNNVSVWSMQLPAGPAVTQELIIPLARGRTILEWSLDGKLMRSRNDPRALGFMIENPTLSVP